MTPLTAARPAPVPPLPSAREHLDGLYRRFDRRFLSPDPLEFLHRYDDPADIEIRLLRAGWPTGAWIRSAGRLRNWVHCLGRAWRGVRQFEARRDTVLFGDFAHRFMGRATSRC
jgi:hypothetical protein